MIIFMQLDPDGAFRFNFREFLVHRYAKFYNIRQFHNYNKPRTHVIQRRPNPLKLSEEEPELFFQPKK